MSFWSILNPTGLLKTAKIGSKWRWEGVKARRARRMALAWRLAGPAYKFPAMVSGKVRKQFIVAYGDDEMNKILQSFDLGDLVHRNIDLETVLDLHDEIHGLH